MKQDNFTSNTRLATYLADKFCRLYSITNEEDIKDYKQVSLISLWNSSNTYRDIGKATFQTYATKVIWNGLLAHLKECIKQNNQYSYDDAMKGKEDLSNSLEDLETYLDITKAIDEIPIIGCLFDTSVDLDLTQIVLVLLLEGETKAEIMRMFNLTKYKLNKIVKNGIEILRQRLL